MKVLHVLFVLLLSISLILSVGVVRADPEENSSRIQGLEMDLANETAARIEKDTDLQQQISGYYSGVWDINGRDYGTCPNPEGAIWSGIIVIDQVGDTMTITYGTEEPLIGTMSGNIFSQHMAEGTSTLDTVITFSGTTYSGTIYYVSVGGGACYLNNFIFGERISD